ncbi:MAG: helix-turn-helix transcriptional regulator [Granulosicoccus sp.]
MNTLQDKLAELTPERRASVMARADELIAEELTLRQLREALNLTQSVIAERLDIGQHSVSRMENRGDIKLSTLRAYIEALGGQLNITATFPDQCEVKLQPSTDHYAMQA